MGSSARCSNLCRKNPTRCPSSPHKMLFLFTARNVGTQLVMSWMRGGNEPMTPPVRSPEQRPGPNKAAFLHRWHPQTETETVPSLSFLLLSLVNITPTALPSTGEILFIFAGAATLLSQKDFISQNRPVNGVAGKGNQTKRRYPPFLVALLDVRDIFALAACDTADTEWLHSPISSNRDRGLSASHELHAGTGKHGPCLGVLAALLQSCSRAQM